MNEEKSRNVTIQVGKKRKRTILYQTITLHKAQREGTRQRYRTIQKIARIRENAKITVHHMTTITKGLC